MTNDAEETATTVWDPVCGVPIETNGANQAPATTTTMQYDELCRPERKSSWAHRVNPPSGVSIGVIFVYALVSIICSAIREGIEAWLKTRGVGNGLPRVVSIPYA